MGKLSFPPEFWTTKNPLFALQIFAEADRLGLIQHDAYVEFVSWYLDELEKETGIKIERNNSNG